MKVELNKLSKMNRYKENLLVSDDTIFSYLTPVATIHHADRQIFVRRYWSPTTSTHINYVGREYGYTVLKGY